MKLPFVFVNVAMTADGKIASGNHVIPVPGSKRDKAHLMELRTHADAVMSGARTVDLNPVHLGPGPAKYRRLRLRRGLAEYNLRIIVSGSGSIDPGALIFKKTFSPIIILTTDRIPRRRLRVLQKLATEVKICGRREIDLRAALAWLRAKWRIKRLLCEGGGEVNDSLFRAGLVDELHLTICPWIFGGQNAPTLSDGLGVERLADAYLMKLKSMRRVGGEIFLVFRRV